MEVIKNPFKKFICILAMKYWRWLQRTNEAMLLDLIDEVKKNDN